ncbi:tetratricopeptide repeat protein [bacterium]|nr:tetratricopeptide repeat protein [bacterium]
MKNLLDRGLIFQEGKLFDFHPIIRSYAYDRLTDREGVHSQLRDYFKKIPGPEGKVQSLEELNPVIELYHHTVRAGRFDDALSLYQSRLSKVLYYQFGDYNLVIELLTTLFPDGLDKLPKLSQEKDQSFALNHLAIAFTLSGQSRKAIPLFERKLGINRKNKDTGNEIVGLQNLSIDNIALGRIKEAENYLRIALKLAIEAESKYGEAVSRQLLGRLLIFRGCLTEADNELNLAVSLYEQHKHTQGLTVARSFQAFAATLQGKYEAALDFSEKAQQYWQQKARESFPYVRDRVQVEWLLGWSKTGLASEKPKQKNKLLKEAEQHLTEALTRCRKVNLIELEPDILLTWARWHRANENPQEARKYCDEALDIADRCEYRLCQADIHNFIALLELEAGHLKEAKRQAEIGKERAYCDGPPYHYKPAYDESERLLKEIAAIYGQ